MITAASFSRASQLVTHSFTDDQMLIPPLNFAMVAPGVYRSGFPGRKNYAFLRKLGLRSILCLCPEENLSEIEAFAEDNDIQLVGVALHGNREPFMSIPENAMLEALQHLLDVRNHPVLIHCSKGKHRTGCVLGCLRKLQRWSLTSITDEYCLFAGARVRILDQQFIEFFSPEDVISTVNEVYLPRWL